MLLTFKLSIPPRCVVLSVISINGIRYYFPPHFPPPRHKETMFSPLQGAPCFCTASVASRYSYSALAMVTLTPEWLALVVLPLAPLFPSSSLAPHCLPANLPSSSPTLSPPCSLSSHALPLLEGHLHCSLETA